MSLYIDRKFADSLSSRLELFKWLAGDKAQFRCPLCGDSKKNRLKTRGGLFPSKTKDTLMFSCFNCGGVDGKPAPFGVFLKRVDSSLYQQYILEKFKEGTEHKYTGDTTPLVVKPVVREKPVKKSTLDMISSIASLPNEHEAKKYILDRKIPKEFHDKLFYTENFKKWINEHVSPNKFKKPENGDARIVIPFYNAAGKPFAYQGRALGEVADGERYITINPNPDRILLFGVERLDDKKKMFALEGPFDSMFVPNAVAVAGSALTKLLKYKKLKPTFIFDNEPRSKEICKLMEEVIDAGKEIVIWPKSVDGLKDVNKMVQEGKNILDIINKNCYTGVIAKMRFQSWKKI